MIIWYYNMHESYEVFQRLKMLILSVCVTFVTILRNIEKKNKDLNLSDFIHVRLFRFTQY